MCERYFSSSYKKTRHGKYLIERIVRTYFDTRGSYRRTAKSIDRKLSHMQIYRIVNKLGQNCKSCVQVTNELHPKWSGFLGLDGKTVRVNGEKLVLLAAVDLGTQDMVDFALANHEDYRSTRAFLKEISDSIGYEPKLAVIDLDQAWKEAVSDIFPDVPIQYCVVHFERIFDREIPLRNRTEQRHELKRLARKVLYAPNYEEAKEALEEILFNRKIRYFRDKKSLSMIRSLQSSFDLLTTHFRLQSRFRSNNITEGVNNLVQMRLDLIRGYKKKQSAWNSLKLIIMHYRFNPFESCKDGTKNGKCPLNLAGVDTSSVDWIAYCLKDPFMLDQL